MESCWWAFKELFDKDQVYRAYQIMPFSTALCTPLSHMESKQNEKTTIDPAVWVSFPIKGRENSSLVIYTTTPWTLPSNLLIAVHPDFEYVEILDHKSGKQYILFESGIPALYKPTKGGKKDQKEEYKIVNKMKGKDLIGLKYEPLFPYFKDSYAECFQVIGATYVEEGEGTGLVHQAPAFGQEDYDAAKAAGFVSPERLPPCPVDDAGLFTDEVPDYAGQHVKVADKAIIKDLKASGRLLFATQVSHSDKFCWRSDTQLIRKAVSSWFIRVTDSIPQLLENLEPTTWVPSFVKEKRFTNWISAAPDWNVSRNRYWGTPLPLWVSEDYDEVVCVGSIAELKKLSGYTGELTDIHCDKLEAITIPSKKGKGQLRRVGEVFDCWFESGSMPYASNHYPFAFKGKEETFEENFFPADFIAEGLDQTRGWFYTLSILGHKLFGTSPFKAVIVNGLILAKDGKKMSKSLKNFPDPSTVINQYGADALRLYLIHSPVVRGEPLRFDENGVREVVTKALLPLWNSFRFFREQTELYKKTTGRAFGCTPISTDSSWSNNVMDRWVSAACQSMIKFVDQEMSAYRLYTVVPRLLHLVEDLTNYYIRFNRKRLKGTASLGEKDTEIALNTLCHTLFTLVRCLAPFIPFLTEHIYQLLKPYLSAAIAELNLKNTASVHFLPFPSPQESLFDPVVERKMAVLQRAIELGRTAKTRRNVTLKTPVRALIVIADDHILRDIEDTELQSYIKEELNVRDIVVTSDQERYKVQLEARVDWPTLGKKLKKDSIVVRNALPKLSQDQLRGFLETGEVEVGGIPIVTGDITVVRALSTENASDVYEPASSDDGSMIVLMDMTPDAELARDGLVRDVVGTVQRLRKKARLVPTDEISVRYSVVKDPGSVKFDELVDEKQDKFVSGLGRKLTKIESHASTASAGDVILEEEQQFGELVVMLQLCKVT